MERRKAKISIICVSIVMILSMLLTFLGVYAFKNPLITGGNNIGTGITAGLNYNQNNYVGAVSGGSDAYIKEKQYGSDSTYEEITSGLELSQFLLQTGKYQGKNGFLSQDITFNWTEYDATRDDSNRRAGLAPLSVKELTMKFDGCGNTITYEGNSVATVVTESYDGLSVPLTECMIVNDTSRGHKVDDKSGYKSSNVSYHAFGGMLNVLGVNGSLKNFKFVINSTHGFHYNSGSDNQKYGNNLDGLDNAHVAFGGLVGYNNGGVIDNVAVELASNKALHVSSFKGRSSNNNNVFLDYIFASRRVVAAIFQGLVVGVSDGGADGTGKITNVSGLLNSGSHLRTQAGVGRWDIDGTPECQQGAAIVGGIVGGLLNKAVVSNAEFSAQGNAYLDADVRKFVANRGTNPYQSYRVVGGIVGANMNGNITSAMVTGKNLNCMRVTGDNLGEFTPGVGALDKVYTEAVKDLFVGEGARPTNMIYKDAEGGQAGVPEGNKHPDKENYPDTSLKEEGPTTGYRTPDTYMVELSTTAQDNGNGGGEIKFYFSHDSYDEIKDEEGNVTGTVQSFDKAMIFVPDTKLLWNIYGKDVYDNLYRGATNVDIPTYNDGKEVTISVGNSDRGEIGFYKIVPNAIGANEGEHIYEYANLIDGKVTYWQEMSDQSRAARKGLADINVEENKLYYNGYTYELKLKVTIDGKTQLYDKGLRIRNNGNLKHAKMLNDGSPVTLALDIPEGKTEDTTVAYVNTDRKLLITRDSVDGMGRTLAISKRDLIVTTENYVEGESTVFSGAKVTFSGNDDNSGLVAGESILWQETSFAPVNGAVTIDLNIAGYQMLRPSTNNYVVKTSVEGGIYDESTTFVAHIMPHEIEVGEGIYINGAAVGGQYNVVNNKNYSTGANDTVGNAKNDKKRKIRISTRFNNGYFTAEKLILETASGRLVLNDGDMKFENGFRYIEFTVTNADENLTDLNQLKGKLTKIYFEKTTTNYHQVVIKDEYAAEDDKVLSNNYEYGDMITLQANTPDGQQFTGWQVDTKETAIASYELFTSGATTYLSFQEKFSFKVKEKISITACYASQNDKWLQTYVDSYGQTLRTRIADDAQKDNSYNLYSVMGSEFTGWKEISRDEATKTITFQATYAENPNPAQVQLIRNDSVSWVNYGTAITLKKDKSYVVNGSLVEVVRNDIEIYAINNLIIMDYDPNIHKDLEDISLRHRSFQYGNEMYINITFTYGYFDTKYDTNITAKAPNGKPVVDLLGFNETDITEYVRQGNIYQISIVIDMQELAYKFGDKADIVTSLKVSGGLVGLKDYGALEIM